MKTLQLNLSCILCLTRILSLNLMIWGYIATVICVVAFKFWETKQIVSNSVEQKKTHTHTNEREKKIPNGKHWEIEIVSEDEGKTRKHERTKWITNSSKQNVCSSKIYQWVGKVQRELIACTWNNNVVNEYFPTWY